MTLENLRQKPQLLIGILILYYCVGILLYLIDGTRTLFSLLTPWSLILSFSAVMIFQKGFSVKLGVAFAVVFTFTLLIEIIGVNTGILFGNYEYGPAFGPKILSTPILIGLNWLILIYCSAAIVNHHFTHKITRVISGSLLMVAYDLILEYVAPVMDMWSWDAPYPGIRNFLMWFVVAMVLHLLFQRLGLSINNKPARYLFFIQILFFCVIAFSTLWIN
jgi:putative membrane protein